MPKEIVRSKYYEVEGEGPAATDNEEPYVHIGWTKNGEHVEISVANPKGKLAVYCDQSDSVGEYTIIDATTPGWFAQLDRDQINQLIRHLRKARDDAYGRDE